MPIGDDIVGDGILGDGIVSTDVPPSPTFTFPDLSTSPLVDPWEESAAVDPTLRSAKEAGYTQTRAQFTRVPWKYHLEYGDLTQEDKDTLRAWEIGIKVGTDSFTHPDIGQINVRLAGPIKYKRHPTSFNLWTAALDVEEV